MIDVTQYSFAPSETKISSEKMGYRVEEPKAMSVDGNGIVGAVVLLDEEANGGHYDELTALKSVTLLVWNGSCPRAYGDHLIVSDGQKWHYSEALHGSNYPAVRVEPGGIVQPTEVDDARQYWTVYSKAIGVIRASGL